MARDSIDPIEIGSTAGNGESASTYVFDISDHLLAGDVCVGLALALSTVLDRDVDSMTPISNVVDCDAMELLFRTQRYGDLRDDVSVSFPYDVYTVTVGSSGRVVVAPENGPPEAGRSGANQ